MKSIHRSILTRALMTGVASLAFMIIGAGGVRADTVGGGSGADGANCDLFENPTCVVGNGGDGESVSAGGNPATAFGGNGGEGGQVFGPVAPGEIDGNGGAGGSGTAFATGKSRRGDVTVSASAGGGNGGSAAVWGNGGNGGSGEASAIGRSGRGNVTVSASATGGEGGMDDPSYGGSGGNASATSKAFSGSGEASSSAYAMGGGGLSGGLGGSATATANATATRGGLAISQAAATGGERLNFGGPNGAANATSTAKSTFAVANVRLTDEAALSVATTYGTATSNAVAQAGGAGQGFIKPDNSAYAFSTVLPDKADVATLIDGASTVASAFLGPRDIVFGTAILGITYFPDQPVDSFTFSESSTFDFSYRGDLLLGVIDGDVSVIINGVQVLADEFVDDGVINLGSSFGPNIDLTIVSYGGEFILGGAAPEPSTWAMMLVGFAGLGFAGYGSTRRRAVAGLRA